MNHHVRNKKGTHLVSPQTPVFMDLAYFLPPKPPRLLTFGLSILPPDGLLEDEPLERCPPNHPRDCTLGLSMRGVSPPPERRPPNHPRERTFGSSYCGCSGPYSLYPRWLPPILRITIMRMARPTMTRMPSTHRLTILSIIDLSQRTSNDTDSPGLPFTKSCAS